MKKLVRECVNYFVEYIEEIISIVPNFNSLNSQIIKNLARKMKVYIYIYIFIYIYIYIRYIGYGDRENI